MKFWVLLPRCVQTNFFIFFYRYSVAESDCNLALALDKNYTKAYARRGAARFALKNLQGAKEGGSFLKFLKYIQTVCLLD